MAIKEFDQVIEEANKKIDAGQVFTEPAIVSQTADGHREHGFQLHIYNDNGKEIVGAVFKQADEEELAQ